MLLQKCNGFCSENFFRFGKKKSCEKRKKFSFSPKNISSCLRCFRAQFSGGGLLSTSNFTVDMLLSFLLRNFYSKCLCLLSFHPWPSIGHGFGFTVCKENFSMLIHMLWGPMFNDPLFYVSLCLASKAFKFYFEI